MNTNPSTEQAGKIIYNLRRGIVPEDGFQYFAVGRQEEVIGDLEGLEHVKNGGSTVKILIGDFGSGKTLEKNRCRMFASKKGFVTSAVDFGPGIRLYANDGTSLALWKHIVENLSPSLETVLDSFAAKCREVDSMKLAGEIVRSITGVDSIYFNQMILKYVKAYEDEDATMKDSVIRWLSGAYRRRDDARRDLGQDVEEIMTDGNWYNILKCFSRFVSLSGFSGLALYLDEAINLYKIDSPALREKNYEKLLGIINDKCPHLYIMILGTETFLTNRKRGLYSYGALATRLSINPHTDNETQDYSQPVVKLMPLDNTNIYLLLQNVRNLYNAAYGTEVRATDYDLQSLMEEFLNKPGAGDLLQPRELIRGLIFILDLLRDYPGKRFSDYCKLAAESADNKADTEKMSVIEEI